VTIPHGEITRMLSEAVGAEHLSSSVADTSAHAVDFWPRDLIRAREERWPPGPAWVVWPGAAAEVSHVLRIASAYAIPVIPYGAGSNMVGGASPRGDRPWIVLNCTRMSDLLDLDEVSMIAHAQAGILGVELEERLNARGLSLGHVPTSTTTSTLGGWLSTRSVGLLSSRYGRIDELCLGLTVVLADGQVIHTRVAPRRAVGPDLIQLLVGAEGTLGVITAAHLRLHRLPLHRQFDTYRFADLPLAAEALRRILARGVRPLVARIQDDPRWRREVDGAEPEISDGQPHPPDGPAPLLILAYEGPPELVEGEAAVVADVATQLTGEAMGPAPARRWWGQRLAGVFRLGPLLSAPGAFADQLDIGVCWSDLEGLHRRLTATLTEQGLRVFSIVEHARLEGVCLSCTFAGQAEPAGEALAAYDRAWATAAEVVRQQGGWLGHVYGAGRHRASLLDDVAQARLRLLSTVKRKLDPAGILNPGILGSEP
jgi:alkyldihydroxyacetonephosphate synthase